jgi:hypothetical protein
MSDVYPTTNFEAMVEGRLQEEGNQLKANINQFGQRHRRSS